DVDNAIKKIVERGRDFELGVERGYWNSLNEEYCDFFNNYTDTVVLKINIDNMDIRDNPEDRKLFFDTVKSKLKELNL
ncbi:MAG: deoxynucleoside kinase, partial [Cetobacterium sp.]